MAHIIYALAYVSINYPIAVTHIFICCDCFSKRSLILSMFAVTLSYDSYDSYLTLICKVALTLLYNRAAAHIHLCCDSKYTATATVNICFI